MLTAPVVMILICLLFLSIVAYYSYQFFFADREENREEKRDLIFHKALADLSSAFILLLSLLLNDKWGLLAILHNHLGDISVASIAQGMLYIVMFLVLIYFFCFKIKFSRSEG
ncbi:hypothetical protein PL84_03690 [Vibrio anguillarum]|uniref:hypothetical protein n=1 Tax=Vibrio anguillarum TaxID=55601 RepID=UPI00097E255D|nr:hypothetical protein [Vibrio anguillarum]MBT2909684.1 hypothetical protein [Vibrio anguillarum]MBT2942465.1 hypothetical protein [Vibrio anguillarum]MBT2950711.1 hypothetical protein [Vibrio anguillarum]MBT2979624.1 hypothetical protein [Vibrio anguillarum]